MRILDTYTQYILGRSNLAVTIFVPYDCPNNCPFCTSKDEYTDTSNFSLRKILTSLDQVAGLNQVRDIVITGGEPFADLTKLQIILDACKKHCDKNVYINTTLPVIDEDVREEIFEFILKNHNVITGLNISRHMCLKTKFEDDSLIETLYNNTKLGIRINSVLLGVEAEYSRVSDFITKYSHYVTSINFRGDYTKIRDQNDLRGLDNPFLQILFNLPELTYITSGGCLVCNNNDFITQNKVYVSLHRGYEHSLVKLGRYHILNDIIIKQDGRILSDWDGEELDVYALRNQWARM